MASAIIGVILTLIVTIIPLSNYKECISFDVYAQEHQDIDDATEKLENFSELNVVEQTELYISAKEYINVSEGFEKVNNFFWSYLNFEVQKIELPELDVE